MPVHDGKLQWIRIAQRERKLYRAIECKNARDPFLESLLLDPSYDRGMDCEGFQDLKLWCDLSAMADLNTPHIDKERRFAFGNTLNTSTTYRNDMNDEAEGDRDPAGGAWDMFSIMEDGCLETENLLPASPYSRETFINDLNINELDIQNMPVVFKDLPKYEESVNIVTNGQVFMGAVSLAEVNPTLADQVIIKDEDWELPIQNEVNVIDDSSDAPENMQQAAFINFEATTQQPHSIHKAPNVITDLISNVEKSHEVNNGFILQGRIHNIGDPMEDVNYYEKSLPNRNIKNLNLHIERRALYTFSPVVTTPDVLRTVEQLEADKKFNLLQYVDNAQTPPTPNEESLLDSYIENRDNDDIQILDITPPETPKLFELEKRPTKRRRDSVDSDDSYVPPTERKTQRSTKKRKTSVSKVLAATRSILELNLPKKKGRPPKRRESMASTCTYTTDDNISTLSVEEHRYRELRDKNNEASRRSRLNRKLKELDNERVADELEQRNRMLSVKAERLEKTAKLLKDALMAAMLKR